MEEIIKIELIDLYNIIIKVNLKFAILIMYFLYNYLLFYKK